MRVLKTITSLNNLRAPESLSIDAIFLTCNSVVVVASRLPNTPPAVHSIYIVQSGLDHQLSQSNDRTVRAIW